MNNIQILIADDDGGIEQALGNLRKREADRYDLLFSSGVDETLEKIVNGNPDLCLVCEKNGDGNARGILRDLKESGFKTPVVTIVGPEHTKIEPDLIALGGKGVIPYDSSMPTVLRYFVHFADDLKQTRLVLNAEKEGLIRQFIDQRDARERAEEQSMKLIGLAEDLAATKEKFERLNVEKNKFFSIIAHDLRSPFNAILGYTELLARTADNLTPDQVKEFAGNAHAAGASVFNLLENLLEWSQLQMNRIDCAPATISLGEIVGRTIELLAPVAEDKNIKLETAVTKETVYADPDMIETVIRNLINNAIKFTNKGGSVVIAAQNLDDVIEVSVTDTGVGMEPDRAAAIFSLSGNHSTDGTQGEKGTGLGLSLSKELVERNGGEIYATSKPGKGSTFAFTVPKNPPEN